MKYDVIVVGAGAAGCVLAARLSEDPGRSVLLLEAGPDYPDFERLPDQLKYVTNRTAWTIDSPHNWSFVGYPTQGQPGPTPVPRGKVVGGGSAINGGAFVRGDPEDYDSWANLGNHEWSYLKVLPYFRKLERDLDIQDDFHGTHGPIPIRRYSQETWYPFQRAFYQACVDMGFPEHPDMNHPEAQGVGPVPMNQLDGVRMSTALTYVNPIRHRMNLTIRPNVRARRVMFAGMRATGVEVESGGDRFVAEAEDIILSAGAIASPHLLMLSGVGPRDQLSKMGIPVVHDLPGVGQNLRDHPQVAVRIRVRQGFALDPDGPRRQAALRYTAQGSSARNDMLVSPVSFASPLGSDPMSGEGVHLSAALYLAAGAGELRLTSADPHAQPFLDYRYLQDPWDRRRLREAVRTCIQLLEHPAMGKIVETVVSPTELDLDSDAALDAWMLKDLRMSPSQHMSGTCKMGPKSDPTAVVDQYCRVQGLEGLRVVDTSIMPDVVHAQTNATAVMIGERAADLISEQI